MRLRVYGCAWKRVEVLASFITCACSRRIFVSVCEFFGVFHQRRILCFRASFAVLVTQKKLSAQSTVSYFFSPVRSRRRRLRFLGASARFPAPLTRARSPVKARAWRGQGGGDVAASRASLVLCLGSQILNFHSRAFSQLFFFK